MVAAAAACTRQVTAERRGSATAAENPTVRPVMPPVPAFREVTIPAGTKLGVRLVSSIGSKISRPEEPVEVTLIAPLRIGGRPVLPTGSRLTGDVTSVRPAGKVKGRASLAVRLRKLIVGADSYPIAAQISRVAPATKAKDAEKIGIPAAGGAVIGALLGGGKGAAIGATAGGGAGTAVVLSTSGKEVSLPRGSVVSVRLQQPVTVRVAAQ
jgi:hypothetical protein